MKTRLGLVGREDGFLTLLEAILTMVIVLIFLMLPSLNIEQAKLGVETDLFTENLRTQITLMNQNAVLKGEMSVVEVEPGRNRIVFSVMGQPQSPWIQFYQCLIILKFMVATSAMLLGLGLVTSPRLTGLPIRMANGG